MFFQKQREQNQELEKRSQDNSKEKPVMNKRALKNIEVYVPDSNKSDFVTLSGTLSNESYYICLYYFVDFHVSIQFQLKSGEKMTSWAYFKNVDELYSAWEEVVGKALNQSDVNRVEIVFTATAKDPSEETNGHPSFDVLNTSGPCYKLASSKATVVHLDELENLCIIAIESLFYTKVDSMYEDLVTQLTALLNELPLQQSQ